MVVGWGIVKVISARTRSDSFDIGRADRTASDPRLSRPHVDEAERPAARR